MDSRVPRSATAVTAPVLDAAQGLRHGFFGRRGGVSTGVFDSLNCGQSSGDQPDRVAENRARVAARLEIAPGRLLSAFQTHSADVLAVAEPWGSARRPRVDGLVTDRPDLALSVLAADCGPVLLADDKARVIGACHAGWRGALGGILEATIGAMEELGAARDDMAAALGPTIAQPSYEVGPEFPAPFMHQDEANERFFAEAERDGHFLFDLPGYILARLTAAGVRVAEDIGRDTCAEEQAYFSYRRNTKRGEKRYGRNISAIALSGG